VTNQEARKFIAGLRINFMQESNEDFYSGDLPSVRSVTCSRKSTAGYNSINSSNGIGC
jgi:hypothetical protein